MKNIKVYFDKNLRVLIENSDYSLKEISTKLKIPLSSLEKILDGKLEDFSIVSLKDIANRLSQLLNEEIKIIYEDDENSKPEQKTKNKKGRFKIVLIIFFIVNFAFLYFVIKDLTFYRNFLYKNLYTITISNHTTSEIIVNDTLLAPENTIKIELAPGESIKVKGNKNNGNIVITTLNAVYNVNLENFEVILSNGKS